MQRLQLITVLGLMRSLLSGVDRQLPSGGSLTKSKSNRIDAEAISDHLKQDLGLIDAHDRRHPTHGQPSAFDAARAMFLRRSL